MKQRTSQKTRKKRKLKVVVMNETKFEYAYSAKKHEEIEAIKKKYLPQEEDKMETLRKLDKSVESVGTAYALVIGIIGALIFGGGMSLVMTIGTTGALIGGIILGLIGAVPIGMAYPVYKKKVQKQKLSSPTTAEQS